MFRQDCDCFVGPKFCELKSLIRYVVLLFGHFITVLTLFRCVIVLELP